MKAPNRPFCQHVENCAAIRLFRHCKPCGYAKSSVTKKANPILPPRRASRPEPVRTHCAKPYACTAKRKKHHCHSCAAIKKFAESPELRARHSETSRARLLARNADRAFQEKARAGKLKVFSRRHGIPDDLRPVFQSFVRNKGYSVKEAAAIVRRDLVKGA
jgi:hypothetical protein